MSKRLNFLSSVAISLCLSLPLAAVGETNANTVVANVNGTDITLGHMILVREGLSEQYKALPDELLYTGILDQLIQQTLLNQTYHGDIPTRIVKALENEKRTLIAAEMISALLLEAATEDEIQAAYEEQYGGASVEREYSAAHILVETKEEAEKLIAELNDGAPFAKMARDHSTGPSGPNGGDLGWFGTGQMVKPFEDAVVVMEAGEISAPVQTRFGWHIIKLNEVRVQEAPAFATVRDELKVAVQEQAVKKHIDALLLAAEITRPGEGIVDPALIKNTDLLED